MRLLNPSKSRLPVLRAPGAALFAVLLLLIGACGEDGSVGPGDTDPSSFQAAVGEGQLDPAAADFVLTVDDPVHGGPAFVLLGEGLRHEDGALRFELRVRNDTDQDLRLPARLTFVELIPDSVRVIGADNGEAGPGAAFELDFAEDDLQWSPGETSLPRSIAFEAEPGMPIGFVVRIDLGMVLDGGSIGGLVYEDFDADGRRDEGENGIAGARIELSGAGFDTRYTETGADGSYRFDGLAAGLYTVRKMPAPFVAPTSAVEMQVVLVEIPDGGGVARFLSADFGCLFAPQPPEPPLEVGDWVEVGGRYDAERDVLVAHEVEREFGHPRFDDEHSELRGPVTAVLEDGVFGLMGRRVSTEFLVPDELHHGGPSDECDDRGAGDLVIGERIRARVSESDAAVADSVRTFYAERISCWSGAKDQVHGVIEAIDRDAQGGVVRLQVLGLIVEVDAETGGPVDPPLAGSRSR